MPGWAPLPAKTPNSGKAWRSWETAITPTPTVDQLAGAMLLRIPSPSCLKRHYVLEFAMGCPIRMGD